MVKSIIPYGAGLLSGLVVAAGINLLGYDVSLNDLSPAIEQSIQLKNGGLFSVEEDRFATIDDFCHRSVSLESMGRYVSGSTDCGICEIDVLHVYSPDSGEAYSVSFDQLGLYKDEFIASAQTDKEMLEDLLDANGFCH